MAATKISLFGKELQTSAALFKALGRPVKKRLHIGFDDPSHVTGTEEYIHSEFILVRVEIKEGFYKLYKEEIEPQL